MIKKYDSVKMQAAVAADRAIRVARWVAEGNRAGYKLGKGGRNPANKTPLDVNEQADCSGATAHFCGYDRFQGYEDDGDERWVNTDAILYAARPDAVEKGFASTAAIDDHGEPMFRVVRKGEQVMPGDLLVYGSTKVSGVRVPGHVGMITAVPGSFVRGGTNWWKHLTVVHCSPSNSRKFGPGHAIAATDAAIWRKKGYIVRPTFYVT